MSDEEINKEIRKKGAKWVAGKTSLSEMSPEERAKRLGLLPKPDEKKAEKKGRR